MRDRDSFIALAKESLIGFREYRDYMDLYDKGTDTACDHCPCKECCDYISEFEKVRRLRKESDCDDMWKIWKTVKGDTND